MIFRSLTRVQRLFSKVPGEAETGNAGEQPDRGIAGRNSSADDEKERGPPDAFFCLGSGPISREVVGPEPGVGFEVWSETPSDQIDSAMP